jgi:hypothetical protein
MGTDHLGRLVNRVGEAEQERLGLFAEECGEALQIVGKILRHGLDSSHPEMPLLSNKDLLEMEVGHIVAAFEILVACGTLNSLSIFREKVAKLEKLQSWLHCGTNLDAVAELLKRDKETLRENTEQSLADSLLHKCDAPNIAQAADGTFYCAHCGWNDPKGVDFL